MGSLRPGTVARRCGTDNGWSSPPRTSRTDARTRQKDRRHTGHFARHSTIHTRPHKSRLRYGGDESTLKTEHVYRQRRRATGRRIPGEQVPQCIVSERVQWRPLGPGAVVATAAGTIAQANIQSASSGCEKKHEHRSASEDSISTPTINRLDKKQVGLQQQRS